MPLVEMVLTTMLILKELQVLQIQVTAAAAQAEILILLALAVQE
jgi:hypothetical protein